MKGGPFGAKIFFCQSQGGRGTIAVEKQGKRQWKEIKTEAYFECRGYLGAKNAIQGSKK